jgi:Cys-rich protein (TIGR01571 family)
MNERIKFILPCVSFGNNAESMGKSCIGWGLFYSCFACVAGPLLRYQIRGEYNIEGSWWLDLLNHCCCCCAVHQETIEIECNTKKSVIVVN